MEIEGYTYITHKLIDRPWYPECRYTFARSDGSHICIRGVEEDGLYDMDNEELGHEFKHILHWRDKAIKPPHPPRSK